MRKTLPKTYNGSFSEPEMRRPLTYPSRKHFACILLFLIAAITGLVAQSSTIPSPSVSLPGSQSPFTGSEPEGKAASEVLQLTFQDAIERGLRNNLGLLLSGDQTIMARGERWKELSNLLPNLQARVQAVSYTHLDVYKRQALRHAPSGRRARS